MKKIVDTARQHWEIALYLLFWGALCAVAILISLFEANRQFRAMEESRQATVAAEKHALEAEQATEEAQQRVAKIEAEVVELLKGVAQAVLPKDSPLREKYELAKVDPNRGKFGIEAEWYAEAWKLGEGGPEFYQESGYGSFPSGPRFQKLAEFLQSQKVEGYVAVFSGMNANGRKVVAITGVPVEKAEPTAATGVTEILQMGHMEIKREGDSTYLLCVESVEAALRRGWKISVTPAPTEGAWVPRWKRIVYV